MKKIKRSPSANGLTPRYKVKSQLLIILGSGNGFVSILIGKNVNFRKIFPVFVLLSDIINFTAFKVYLIYFVSVLHMAGYIFIGYITERGRIEGEKT